MMKMQRTNTTIIPAQLTPAAAFFNSIELDISSFLSDSFTLTRPTTPSIECVWTFEVNRLAMLLTLS